MTTHFAPAILIEALVTSVVPQATWTITDSSGFLNAPYRWTVVLNITAQPTSYPTSQTPYAYTGLDVAVGQWFSNKTGGMAWQIISISAQTTSTVTCIVEDIYRYNTLSDPTQSGDGSPPALSNGFIFQLSANAVPILSPVIENVITSQWQTDLISRFLITGAGSPTSMTVVTAGLSFSLNTNSQYLPLI